MSEKETLTARIDADLKKKLAELADKEKRSMSNYLEIIIQKHIDEKTGRTGT